MGNRLIVWSECDEKGNVPSKERRRAAGQGISNESLRKNTSLYSRQHQGKQAVMESPSSSIQNSEQQRLVPLSVSYQNGIDVPSLLRKMHKRLLPICVLILVFANIDRGNLGFVANQLCRDLDLTQTQYGIGASIFFVGILFSRIPSNLAMRYFGGPLWLAIIVFSWGILATALAFITHVYHYYSIRFLLGIAEGGAFPGVWYYVTMFFPDDHLTFPYAFTSSAAPIGSALAGPLTTMFTLTEGLFGIEYWRYLFFVEGIVPAMIAPFLYYTLPRDIESASFIQPHERLWLQTKRNRLHDGKYRTFLEELQILVMRSSFWLFNCFSVVHLVLFTVVLYWTTLMIEDSFADDEKKDSETCASSRSLGLVSIILTSVVFITCTVVTGVLGWLARKSTNRNRIAGWITVIGGVSMALWTVGNLVHRVLGLILLTIVACAMNAPTSVAVSLYVSAFDARMKSTALSVMSTIATLGGLFGPVLVGAIVDHYDNYHAASVVVGVIGILGGCSVLMIQDPLKKSGNSESEREECDLRTA